MTKIASGAARQLLATSVALLRAATAAAGMPTHTFVSTLLGLKTPTTLPLPSFNMISGGRYGDVFQGIDEFLVVPYRADSIEVAIEKTVSLFGVLNEVLGRAPLLAASYARWCSSRTCWTGTTGRAYVGR
jgi:enolase